MELYKIENLSFSYPTAGKNALDGISLTVNSGEFAVLAGKSGCGKTTLLRQMKPTLTPNGKRSGNIFYKGQDLREIDRRTEVSDIGFVLQNPENQIVTDKVWHELAFGLESLGCKTEVIRRRVAEMASFFGIADWFHRDVSTLSGGQKQMLNLASVMVTNPKVLILDEPTAQLDPIAASEFLHTVLRINRELGITVILSEHRLEEVLPESDRMIVMENGKILCDSKPSAVGSQLKEQGNGMFAAMPAAMRIYSELESNYECPVSVRDGATFIEKYLENCKYSRKVNRTDPPKKRAAIEFKDVFFRYEKNGKDIVKNLNLSVPEGSLYAVVGANGAGKSTMLSLAAFLLRPYRGSIKLFGKKAEKYSERELYNGTVALLPQNPQTLFVKNSVRLDLSEMLDGTPKEKTERIEKTAEKVGISDLLDRHPYDLSGGEQQRAAIAKLLLLKPKILLLDEPTKGMDATFKDSFGKLLKTICGEGITVLIVSHDIEFCADYADYCAMFFDGAIVSAALSREFFSDNSFYTTCANRIGRQFFENAVTINEVVELCLTREKNQI